MRIGCSGFQSQDETEQAAQSGRTRGPVARNPNRIGNDQRIGAQVRSGFGNDLLEVWRADLFFKLPKETNVDRNVSLDRRACAKECAARGAFVVGGTATVVSVTLLGEFKRLGVPRFSFFRSGLNVDVVVDSDG